MRLFLSQYKEKWAQKQADFKGSAFLMMMENTKHVGA